MESGRYTDDVSYTESDGSVTGHIHGLHTSRTGSPEIRGGVTAGVAARTRHTEDDAAVTGPDGIIICKRFREILCFITDFPPGDFRIYSPVYSLKYSPVYSLKVLRVFICLFIVSFICPFNCSLVS